MKSISKRTSVGIGPKQIVGDTITVSGIHRCDFLQADTITVTGIYKCDSLQAGRKIVLCGILRGKELKIGPSDAGVCEIRGETGRIKMTGDFVLERKDDCTELVAVGLFRAEKVQCGKMDLEGYCEVNTVLCDTVHIHHQKKTVSEKSKYTKISEMECNRCVLQHTRIDRLKADCVELQGNCHIGELICNKLIVFGKNNSFPTGSVAETEYR